MELTELYTGCRTYRRFKQEPIPQELIEKILQNLRLAHSGCNWQVLRYYAVVSPEKVKAMHSLVKYAASLPPELGMPKEGETPVAFLVITKNKDGGFTDVDVGIAAQIVSCTAWEGGFGSCLLGNINPAKIAELLGVPEGEKVRLAIALGKPDHTSVVVDVPESGKLSYYVDDKVDYYVPKLSVEELSKIV